VGNYARRGRRGRATNFAVAVIIGWLASNCSTYLVGAVIRY
jgi:hypothetical protein